MQWWRWCQKRGSFHDGTEITRPALAMACTLLDIDAVLEVAGAKREAVLYF